MAETLTIRTSSSTDVIKVVERGPQGLTGPTGPTGATGPAGAAGASTWSDISGKPSTFTPSAHASSHHTGGSDPITPANIGAAKEVTEIVVYNSGTSTTTLTTGQLPARVILFLDATDDVFATINLPTPDPRQSGLFVSIKVQRETGDIDEAFVTVVHNATTLLNGQVFSESEGSINFVWDGYEWSFSNKNLLASFSNRVLGLPNASGTLALTESADNVFRVVGSSDSTKKVAFEVDTNVPTTSTVALTVPATGGTIARTQDFASPPAIGNTTPNSGSFTTLAANNGTLTASAPVLDLAQTWNDGGTTFIGALINCTATANSSTSSYFEIQRSGTTQFSVVAGNANIPYLEIGGGGYRVRVRGRTGGGVGLNCEGIFGIRDAIELGTTSTSTVSGDTHITRDAADTLALKRNTNPQTFRLYTTHASGTSFERLSIRAQVSNNFIIATEKGTTGGVARGLEFQTDGVARLTLGDAGGVTIADANDIAVGTTTGTKIGTATTQKIGFFNATPVVQQAAIADATDAATTQARLNDLLAAMRTLGLIAT